MHPPIAIRLAGPPEHGLVSRFYAEAGYGAALGADDTVIVAQAGETLVGVVRLCPEEGVTVLRGMQVGKACQGQGIGTRLLAACAPHMAGSAAFCLPYTHLERFYAAAGFARVHDAGLPVFLGQRLAAYRARGQDVIAMRRPAA